MTQDIDLERKRISKAAEFGDKLNQELASMVPPVFKNTIATGTRFRELWQQFDVHTDQLTSDNEGIELARMTLEAKKAWCELLLFSIAQGRLNYLVADHPIIKVYYRSRPSGEMSFSGQLRAGFATDEDVASEQQNKPAEEKL